MLRGKRQKLAGISGAGFMAMALATAAMAGAVEDPRKDIDNTESPAYCGQCHTRIYREWSSSMMGRDLDNPVVYQFYMGTNAKGKFDGLGYKGFMKMAGKPHAKGDCADCHVPVQVIEAHRKGEEVDLGKAMRLETRTDHGIACIFCHSVKDVHLKKDAKGRWSTRIFDTVELEKGVIHGPYPQAEDSPHDKFAVSKVFRTSRICGACHLNQEKVLSISTYADWKALYDAGKTDKTCQDCHMPLIPGKARAADDGPERTGLRHHVFIGARDAVMRKKALKLDLKAEKTADGFLVVKTVVENVGAAHTVPASAPIRNVILKIDAVDEKGNPLPWAGGKKGLLPPLAGFGNPKTKQRGPGDWAGMPGKMYAKAYRSKVVPKLGRPLVGVGGFAAEAEVFNTLLHYKKPDHAQFRFRLPKGAGKVKVTAQLIYRWAYKPLAEKKGWKMPDLPMTQASLTVETQK